MSLLPSIGDKPDILPFLSPRHASFPTHQLRSSQSLSSHRYAAALIVHILCRDNTFDFTFADNAARLRRLPPHDHAIFWMDRHTIVKTASAIFLFSSQMYRTSPESPSAIFSTTCAEPELGRKRLEVIAEISPRRSRLTNSLPRFPREFPGRYRELTENC